MRIARIIEYFPPHVGGMERHGLILSQEQVKLGRSVDIFIGFGANSDYSDKSSDSDYDRLKIYKAPLQFLPLYSKIRRLWFNIWAARQVKKHHKKNPYDIFHFHGDFMEAFFGGRLAKTLSIPAVITIHAGLNKKLLKPKNTKFFDHINKIICVSQEIAQDLEKIGVASEKISVISSGIYLDEFKNVNTEAINASRNQYSRPILISIGVLRTMKGFKYLIAAFDQVKQVFNSATLLIIGDGPEKNNLVTAAEGISGIHFLGRQSHDKIIEYLYASDIFVLASISTTSDREGTPTSIMEAMAAGLPVVTTKVGGNSYLVKEGINGLLIEDRNSDELAEAVIKLIDNPEISEKMKIKNLEDIRQKDWPLIAQKIDEIYKALL